MSAVLCDLEFVGGPFDGYRQLLSIDPGQLVDFATFPVSPTIIRMMTGELPGPIVPGHMVAIYELHHSQDSDHDIYQVEIVRYRYVRQRPMDLSTDRVHPISLRDVR